MKNLFIALAALVAVGCSKPSDDPSDDPKDEIIENIELQRPTESIVVGDTYQMVVNSTPNVAGLKFEWYSSNTDVATISPSGLLEGKSEGGAIITALYNQNVKENGSLTIPISSQIDVYVYEEKPMPQNYTSFVVVNALPNRATIYECVFGYFDADGYCWKLADLGDLTGGQQSKETIVENKDITEIYLFGSQIKASYKVLKPFIIEKSKKNIFVINPVGLYETEWVSKSDPKTYPQDNKAETEDDH